MSLADFSDGSTSMAWIGRLLTGQYKYETMQSGIPTWPFTRAAATITLFRRFGYLQSRLLLEKQADLRSLEQRLEDHDRANISTSYTRTLDADVLLPRQALLAEIEHAFNACGT